MSNRNNLQRGKKGIQLISNVAALQGRGEEKDTGIIRNGLYSAFLVIRKSLLETIKGKKKRFLYERSGQYFGGQVTIRGKNWVGGVVVLSYSDETEILGFIFIS